jgi:hypothetical protein
VSSNAKETLLAAAGSKRSAQAAGGPAPRYRNNHEVDVEGAGCGMQSKRKRSEGKPAACGTSGGGQAYN